MRVYRRKGSKEIAMQGWDPNHIALVSAIEKGKFDKAREILARDTQNEYVHPVGLLKVTALQVAAWQGKIDLLDQLYEKGADVNSVDKIGRCALYYAADRGNADVALWILQHDGDVDKKVGFQSGYEELSYPTLTQSSFVGKNLPLPLCWGRTPLHQAVKNNHVEVVRILINNRADVNATDECLFTPLLLAGSALNRDNPEGIAKFVEIIRILVSAEAKLDVTHPDTDSTALHHAAVLGSAAATRILLSNGASPTYKCKNSGSTPLHIAASTGNSEVLVALLEATKSDCIDICDEVNRTALHRASYQGHRECVRILIDHGANLAAEAQTGVTAIDAIFAHIPRPVPFLTDILDSCVRTNSCPLTKHENIDIDFGILAPKYNALQMAVVTAIIARASKTQLAILQHPLVETFLRLKWSRLRIFFFILVLVQIFFVFSLSSYAMMLTKNDYDYMLNRRILTTCSCLLLFHNMIQMFLEPRYYVKQYETWLSLISVMLSLGMSVAGEIDSMKCTQKEIKSGNCWLMHCISVAVLLGWVQMMLLIGRFPMWGYYALMFSTVLKNILKVLLAFGFLIIGFALSFAVLFQDNEGFRDSWKAIVRTMIMMVGEYDYGDLFKIDDKDQKYYLPITTRIVFFIFVLLASIVLINLMIGLAVNNIQELEREGHIRRLLKQAEFVALLERVTSHRIFRNNWLHPRLKIPTKITLSYHGNYPRHMNHLVKSLREIPVELKEELFQLATKTSSKRNANLAMDENIEDVNAKLTSLLSNLEYLRRWKSRCTLDFANRKSLKQRRALKKKISQKNILNS